MVRPQPEMRAQFGGGLAPPHVKFVDRSKVRQTWLGRIFPGLGEGGVDRVEQIAVRVVFAHLRFDGHAFLRCDRARGRDGRGSGRASPQICGRFQ